MADDQVDNVTTNQDVPEAEATATDSSPESKAAPETGQAPETTGETTDEKFVPYSRFKEVNERLKQETARLQQEIEALRGGLAQPQPEVIDPQVQAVKEQLKALGFVTREEQEAELRRREQDQRVAQELTRLEETYNGSDGRPKFDRQSVIEFALEKQIGDLEAAYKLKHERELVDWQIQQAIAKSKGVKAEASDGSGSSQAGTTDSDLLRTYQETGDKKALYTFLKRLAPKSE